MEKFSFDSNLLLDLITKSTESIFNKYFDIENSELDMETLSELRTNTLIRFSDSITKYLLQLKRVNDNKISLKTQKAIHEYSLELNNLIESSVKQLEKKYLKSLKKDFEKTKSELKTKTLKRVSVLKPILERKHDLMISSEKEKYRVLHQKLEEQTNIAFKKMTKKLEDNAKHKYLLEKEEIGIKWQRKLKEVKKSIINDLEVYKTEFESNKNDQINEKLAKIESRLKKREEKIRANLAGSLISNVEKSIEKKYSDQVNVLVNNYLTQINQNKLVIEALETKLSNYSPIENKFETKKLGEAEETSFIQFYPRQMPNQDSKLSLSKKKNTLSQSSESRTPEAIPEVIKDIINENLKQRRQP